MHLDCSTMYLYMTSHRQLRRTSIFLDRLFVIYRSRHSTYLTGDSSDNPQTQSILKTKMTDCDDDTSQVEEDRCSDSAAVEWDSELVDAYCSTDLQYMRGDALRTILNSKKLVSIIIRHPWLYFTANIGINATRWSA